MSLIELDNTVLLAGSFEDDSLVFDFEDPIEEGFSDDDFSGEGL